MFARIYQSLPFFKKRLSLESAAQAVPETSKSSRAQTVEVDFDPLDPFIAYLLSKPGVAEVDKLHFDSPVLRSLKETGIQICVPLMSQGELVGLINLGPRRSEQEYSTDDRRLLNTLATQAAPALRVAQLVRQQQIEATERERMEQEMRVARLIQQTLLPKELPQPAGWHMAAYYQPARAVGGDFYDFINLPDGQLGFFVGDVTDKGVPAALVMASVRSILRSSAERESSPGKVLERVNDLLCPDIPPKMFATCLYAIINPLTGSMVFANAGHDLPYRRNQSGVEELRATGMPLGLMPGMSYDDQTISLAPGDSVLFSSDGLVEAHNTQREMFGFPRLRERIAAHHGEANLVEYLLSELKAFTGGEWEQEDDVTLVSLERLPLLGNGNGAVESWKLLDTFEIDSQPGNERLAMQQVAELLQNQQIPLNYLQKLITAVAEATMNAMEHGNHYEAGKPVSIEVCSNGEAIMVRITDHGTNQPIPEHTVPDLDAKLAGLQSPRGWGLFLIEKMVDEMRVSSDAAHHTLELIVNVKGDKHVDPNS
ncbi:MAG: GAF domain-containing protein [Chloroflexota bacterium]|nr:MAG: GAF domain-containing protein [Chloroflexota bacterium]